jgi:hypothetical protein
MTTDSTGASGVPSDADVIRQKLETLELSQREAARQLGMDERTMRYYCAGKMPIPPAVLLALNGLQQSPQHAPPPFVLPELQAAFDAVDRRLEPLHELALASQLHQALDQAMSQRDQPLSRAEKGGAFALLGALNFMSRRQYGKPVWDMYWQPLSGWTDRQGTVHHDPDVTQVGDSIISEWQWIARSAEHPVLRARYADVAWEVAKFRVAAARRTKETPAPTKPDAEDAAQAIDGYLQAVEGNLAPEIYDAGRYLGRAVELAATINDVDRLQRAKAIFLEYQAARIADPTFPFWLFDDIAWEQRSALGLSATEKAGLIAGLEQILASRADPSNPSLFDPHSAQDAADRLGQWRRLQGQETEAQRTAGIAGGAIEHAAELASGLTAIAMLERQAKRYRLLGDKESAARVEQAIRRRASQAKGELRRVSTPIAISQDQLDSWADWAAGTTFEEGLARLAGANLIRKGQTEAIVARIAETATLLAHIPISIMREDGYSAAVIGSVADDLEGRTVHMAANAFGYSAPLLAVSLTCFRAKHQVDLEKVMTWLADTELFRAPRLAFMRDGLSAWFAEDWIKVISVLVPQIEAALRDLLSALGGVVTRPDSHHGGFQVVPLGDVLSDPIMRSQLPEDIRFHLRVLLQDPRGLNLRNEFAHGLAAHELYDRGIANWVVHAVIILGLMRVEFEPVKRAGMKEHVTRFKSLAVGLKEIEKFIRTPEQLWTGKPLKGLGGMRPREVVGNWLMCAVLSFEKQQPWCFTSDPTGGDGIIYDPAVEQSWPTEHVIVMPARAQETGDIDALILDAVQAKESKGEAYARGKTLVVFLDAGLGEWKPNVVARKLPAGHFKNVWVIGLNGPVVDGRYTYAVTCIRTGLDPVGNAPTWLVQIHEAFDSWEVKCIQ